MSEEKTVRKFFIGPSGSGKTRALVAEATAAKEAGKIVVVVRGSWLANTAGGLVNLGEETARELLELADHIVTPGSTGSMYANIFSMVTPTLLVIDDINVYEEMRKWDWRQY